MCTQNRPKIIRSLILAFLLFSTGREGVTESRSTIPDPPLLENLSLIVDSLGENLESHEGISKWLDSETNLMQSEIDLVESELGILQSELEYLQARVGQSRPSDEKNDSLPRQARAILAENCFACHGPDGGQRKAGLRLDDGRQIFSETPSGEKPVIPGNPTDSLLLRRIHTSNGGDRMPPAESGKTLSDQERALLVRWVAQGATWESHWAFVPPTRPALPIVQDESWLQNPIDRFVLARLETEDLEPSSEADRYTLIRRVSLDLTGLPPTTEEVTRFVSDTDPRAYAALVDRLLASPHYGEQMARYWLDLARYADTNGYAADIERTMWRYRDWVIQAFNDNMPFDQFTVEQLAGDLLPQPNLSQLIATGFNRNHPIMMEGGAIFEEYRVGNVVDRVDTTATTWLGLTMKCAQCHDHKFDPISQREFYQFYSFFNNVKEEESNLFGTELDGNSVPRVKAPLPAQESELVRIAKSLDEVHSEMVRPIPDLDRPQSQWEISERDAVAKQWMPIETTVVSASSEGNGGDTIVVEGESNLPNMTGLRIEIPRDDIVAASTTIDLSQTRLSIFPGENVSEETLVDFSNAIASEVSEASMNEFYPLGVWNDDLQTGPYAIVYSAASPFGFGDRTRVRLVFRGDGLRPVASQMRISVSNRADLLPATLGPWSVNGPFLAKDGSQALEAEQVDPHRIDLSATYEDGNAKWTTFPGGLPDGIPHLLSGKTCATYFHRTITAPSPRRMRIALDNRNAVRLWLNSRLVFDKEAQRGEVGAHPSPVTLLLREGANEILIKTVDFYDFNSHTFYFARQGEEVGSWPVEVEMALLRDPIERSEDQKNTLRKFYRSRYWDGWGKLFEQQQDLEWERLVLEKQIPTTMVMEDFEAPRATHVLVRGQYDQPADPVSAGVPGALHSWPEGGPQNRLGLARWLMARENPLTARVTVNREWQRFFGMGMVTTPDDFGVQGAPPTHPELLDWLALEFIDSGWDVKALQRLIVTSATYRQTSRYRPELSDRDPQNSFLARGPRYRLEAERIRDLALASSGLLVDEIGGPSVKPYQPAGIWRDVAYGGGGQRYTAQEYVQDHGDKLYRRSLYTFWKRAAAPPSMLLFDAPNREVCTVCRGRSNTPLQSLVLMNDIQYVEAARALATRIMRESGPSIHDRIAHASLLVLARPVRPVEETALRQQFEAQYNDYRRDPESARLLLEIGESAVDRTLDPAELAAWTLVASSLLNTDSAVSQF